MFFFISPWLTDWQFRHDAILRLMFSFFFFCFYLDRLLNSYRVTGDFRLVSRCAFHFDATVWVPVCCVTSIVCKITGRPRRPINRPGDLDIHLGSPLSDQDFFVTIGYQSFPWCCFYFVWNRFPTQQGVIHERKTSWNTYVNDTIT